MTNASVVEYSVVWFQAGTCTGCSVSVLNSVSPNAKNLLVDEIVPGKHISLKFQATLMAGQGDAVINVLEQIPKVKPGKYLFVVEGAIPFKDDGIYGYFGERDGEAVPILERVDALAREALAIIGLGTCAAFGGIAAGKPNPGGYISMGDFLSSRNITKPLINIPGCPPHPDWFVGTVASVIIFGLPSQDQLDEHNRPKIYFGKLIHENCPRRAYFDEGKFARKFGDMGCLHELGCKGPVTHSDCPLRLWNGGINWCIGAGHPCIGCCEPGFPDVMSPLYEKMTEESVPTIGNIK
jgi:hydrogenase small subunit